MKKFTSQEIRELWFKYFTSHGHKKVESSPLIPHDDDTLLWINAGVTPLKRYFDGREVPTSKRMCNIQKCIRTNDIENVGVTRRHHTFFEMMGNFSIGDYFRDEALTFAFELLTSEEYFSIPKEKLYVTVYPDDTDTINKWISLGFIPSHIIPLEDNFWEIGEGPGGPDTEIFFDRGEKYDPNGDALELFKKGEDNERYIEIWNNVLSQYNCDPKIPRKEYKELPSKNIDTGAGLERWACILQDVDSNFDTDLFMPIINKIEDLTNTIYDGSMPYKVLADHIRSLTFALADGATFGNVGRGYILRRLLRRSVRMGRKLGLNGLFMYKLVDSVIVNYVSVYPYLKDEQAHVKALILAEEELFSKTLNAGEKRLYELMDESIDKEISGSEVFKLYDTYGFPYELTLEYLEEKGFTTNKNEFDKCMENQKMLSKQGLNQTKSMQKQSEVLLNLKENSEFIYDKYKIKSKVVALIQDEKRVNKIYKEGYVVLDKTCFYATSGGQIYDTGMILGNMFKARVIDVEKSPNGDHLHKVRILSGSINVGDTCELLVDEQRRKNIEANHSSVHLLQYSLRTLIDNQIHQAGSRVDDKTLRFDFTYPSKLNETDLIPVENMVNKLINDHIKRNIEIKNIKDINTNEVMALFSEKYLEKVRVVEFANSKELCGGTHVKNTEDIKHFAILSLENKGSNTYRIEAATKDNIADEMLIIAKPYNDEIVKQLIKAKSIISEAKNKKIDLEYNNNYHQVEIKTFEELLNLKKETQKIKEEVSHLEKEFNKIKEEQMVKNLSNISIDIKELNNIKYLLKTVENMNINSLKQVMDNIANTNENIFIFIANKTESNINYLCRSNTTLDAGKIVKEASILSTGNGGGSHTFAQGAGKIDKIEEIFANIIKEIQNV